VQISEGMSLVHWSKVQREAVMAEMNRLLADPTFRKSHRCVALLRRIIELALEGDHKGIKERTLGIEVFGRDPDYDNSSDPIVRMTANEIRKRLAQYYQEDGPRHWVRIRLTPGGYIPEFDFLQNDSPESAERKEEPEAHPESGAQHRIGKNSADTLRKVIQLTIQHKWAAFVVFFLLAILTALSLGRSSLFPSSQYLLWKPLLQSNPPLIICVADDAYLEDKGVGQRTDEETKIQLQLMADMIESRKAPANSSSANFHPTIPFSDASVAQEITHWLEKRGHNSMLRSSSTITLQDLRDTPVALVGGFDNPWSVILLSDLRFSLRVDTVAGVLWVRDAQNPTKRDWTINMLDHTHTIVVDYAVVTRFLDPETENWILAIGGTARDGTKAASRLLLDPAFDRSLPAGIRSAKNFQMIVKTSLINGNAGAPQVVAFYAW